MELHLSPPEVVSRNLGIQISTLRKYVTYFAHLLSAYAIRRHNSRYTVEDVKVLKRVTRLGDRISIVLPHKVNKNTPVKVRNPGREIASVSENLDRVFVRVSRLVDH